MILFFGSRSGTKNKFLVEIFLKVYYTVFWFVILVLKTNKTINKIPSNQEQSVNTVTNF